MIFIAVMQNIARPMSLSWIEGAPENPMRRHYATHFPYSLDVERMQMAIKKLEGIHDLTGFTASGTSVEDKVRTITEASLQSMRQGSFNLYLS